MDLSHQRTGSVAAIGPALLVRGLSCRLGSGAEPVLRDIDLELPAGASMAVVGPSGSGKTTLLNCVLGLVAFTGTVTVVGRQMPARGGRAAARVRRRHVGMIFQGNELVPELSPVENVAIAAIFDGQTYAAATDAATSLLTDLGVPIRKRRTAELSGGEQQRVAVARALVNRPELVIADEPTASMDAPLRDRVVQEVLAAARDRDAAVLMVTHDPAVAAHADQVVTLAGGALSTVPS